MIPEAVKDRLVGWRDKLLGRGDAAISIPTLDGACKPNRVLEDAKVVGTLDAPEDLATDGETVFVSDGARVLRFEQGRFVEDFRVDGHITAMACLPGAGMALALDGRRVRVFGGPHDGAEWHGAGGKPFVALNALSATADGRLLATDGSASHPFEKWCFDMMELGSTGRLVELRPGQVGQAGELRSGLRYAFGCVESKHGLWISETWKNQLVRSDAVPKAPAVVDWLPGYPCRINAAPDGGFWLCAFAGRTHLIEFVLREPAFRKRMVAEVDPRYWIAPALSSGDDFLEPLQGAHVKSRGILKPYAPPRSYGLVIKLDERGQPVSSFQSRLDGKHHGAVAAVECLGMLYVLAKGPRRVLQIPLDAQP
jgi:sugar lactone lactonase YvrE